MDDKVLYRIEKLEQSNTRMRRWLALYPPLTLALIAVVMYFASPLMDHFSLKSQRSLTLQEIVLVDANGVQRARIGGDLPNAVIDGKEIKRGSKVAGLILYDKDGIERGGYVTFDHGDNVALTLDSKKHQHALFAAGPDGAVAMQLWDSGQLIELRADENGARLTQTMHDKVNYQVPATGIATQTCRLFLNHLKEEVPEGLSRAEIQRICLKRYTADACEPCLPAD